MNEVERINLDDYRQIGEGGNGKTYVNSAVPGEILKVNHARLSTWEAVKREYDVSCAVAGLGIAVRTVFQKPTFVEKLFFSTYVRKLMKKYW